MALPTFTVGNDSWTVPRGGDLANYGALIDMLGGTDSINFGPMNKSLFTIVKDSNDPSIIVVTYSGASPYQYRLKNVETLRFDSGNIDLTTMFGDPAPTVTAFSPADGSSNASLTGNIVVTFSEGIQKGTGNIVLRTGSATGTVVETFNVASSTGITVLGNKLTINPTNDLASNTHYFVTFDSGSVKDLTGNSYAGTTTYDFTTSVFGTTGNDTLNGTPGADSISGLAGNDILNGLGGIDRLDGGEGSDIYLINSAAEHTAAEIKDSGVNGTDEVRFTAVAAGTLTVRAGDTGIEKIIIGTGTGAAAVNTGTTALNVNATAVLNGLTIIGNAGVNTLTGTAFADTLDGGGGGVADKLLGGLGNDTYLVDLKAVSTTNVALKDAVTENPGAGKDTVILRGDLSAQTEATTLTLAVNVENLDASGTATTKLNLKGNALNNILTGNNSDNVINGGAGADNLIGGLGNDIYVVDNTLDVVTENASAGTDTVRSSITYTLADKINLENVTLTGIGAINAIGNVNSNILTGNSAANSLNGGAGADFMSGGMGDDVYIVDDAGDTVTEEPGGGIDKVKSSISYALADNVENLKLATGSGNINGTGNLMANIIAGNEGNNTLDGGGGAGADNLVGGAGDDLYLVDLKASGTTVALKDTVTEGLNAGTDTLKLRGNFSAQAVAKTLTLGVDLENLDASDTASTKLNLTGNGLKNILTGNDAANVLNGGAGADTLIGGLGNDKLIGAGGADIFMFSTQPNDVSNADIIQDFASGIDKISLDHAIFAALSAGALPTDSFVSGTGAIALDANDHIIYDSASGNLYYDADGSGANAAVKIATMTGHPALTATDILIT